MWGNIPPSYSTGIKCVGTDAELQHTNNQIIAMTTKYTHGVIEFDSDQLGSEMPRCHTNNEQITDHSSKSITSF